MMRGLSLLPREATRFFSAFKMAVRRASQLLRLGMGSAALASIPAMTYNFKVLAAEIDVGEKKLLKISELPLYENPRDRDEYRFEPEQISAFREIISSVREAVWDYLDTVQDTTTKVKEKMDIGRAHTEEMVSNLQNDPGVLPRAVVITVAGLGGIIAGYRGGWFRKVCFCFLAMTSATSLCYPKEAVDVTSYAYEYTTDAVSSLFTKEASDENNYDYSKKDTEKQTPAVVQESTRTTSDNRTTTVKGRTLVGDVGMSKTEDKDMYTTRSK